jgi:hypothetical protein
MSNGRQINAAIKGDRDMTASQPDPKKQPLTIEAEDTVFYLIEGGEDTTRRPRRKYIPLPPKDDQPPTKPTDQPLEEKK